MGVFSDIMGGDAKPRYTYRDLSTLGRILDFIQRPSYTAMNILKELQDPEKREAGEIFAPLYKRRLPEEVKGRGRELWEDVEGLPEWGKTVLGLGTEIVADPTTYLAFGALTKAGRAAQKAGTALSKMPRLAQAEKGYRAAVSMFGQPVLRGLPYFKAEARALQALQPLTRFFKAGAKVPWMQEALEAAQETGRTEELLRTGTLSRLRGLLGKSKKPREFITSAIETGTEVAEEAGQKAVEKYAQARKYIEDLAEYWQLFNPKLADQVDEGMAMGYILHTTTKKGGKQLGRMLKKARTNLFDLSEKQRGFLEELLGQSLTVPEAQFAGAINKWSPFHTSMLARRISRGRTVADLNMLAGRWGFAKMWADDPAELLAKRWAFTGKAVTKSDFMQRFVEGAELNGLALRAENAPEGWEKLSGNIRRFFREGAPFRAKIENLRFDPTTLDELTRVMNAYVNPQEMMEWVKLYDKALGFVKWWTLGPFLPYHVRNAVSDDAWFYGLRHGWTNWGPFADAADIVKKVAEKGGYGNNQVAKRIAQMHPAGILGRFFRRTGLNLNEELGHVVRKGVIGTGFVSAEVPAMGKYMDAMTALGRAREDLSRIAHYLASRAQGLPVDEAVADMLKYHYPYSKMLSPTEKVLSRGIFFYRWLRYNTPGSVRNLFEHWGKHVGMAKAIRTVEESADVGSLESLMPEWMRERGPVKIPSWLPLIGGKKREPRYFLTSAWWPFAELPELARTLKVWEPVQAARPIMERIAPPWKQLMELGTGQESYYKKPISLYPGQRRDLLGVTMPAELAYLARQWRGVTEAERARRRLERTEGTRATIEELLRSVVLGAKSYTFDPEREAAQRFFETIKQVGIVKSEMKREEARGDTETYEYLQRLLDELTGRAEEYRGTANF